MAPALLASASNKPNRPNVPAWKRLGLKLKSAQQSSRPYEAPMPVAPRVAKPKSVKREREAEDREAPHHKKLRNLAKVHEPLADTTPTRSPAQSPIASSPKRRKSVTFTPETKTEDGDSIKQLYNGWVAKNLSYDPNLYHPPATLEVPNPSKASTVDESTVNEVLKQVEGAEKSVRRKKLKRERGEPQSSTNSKKTTKPVADFGPALSYLKQFHESKATWKFNKVHQINLIKNAFDIDKIPSGHIGLFFIYIRGLKGDARRQLRDSAIATMVKDREEVMGEASESLDDVTKKDEFEVTLRNNMKTLGGLEGAEKIGYEEKVLSGLSDLSMKKRMAKRMRAEEILDELAQEALESTEGVNSGSRSLKDSDGDDNTQKRIKLSDGSINKLRRKRKQRTNAVDDESSSSESSISESSSEDEQEVVQEPTDEATSSSSSSSSSTSSEDDEEIDENESSGSETNSDESEP